MSETQFQQFLNVCSDNIDLQNQLKEVRDAKGIIGVAAQAGFTLSEEDLAAEFLEYSKTLDLSDEDLAQVTGGAAYGDPGRAGAIAKLIDCGFELLNDKFGWHIPNSLNNYGNPK